MLKGPSSAANNIPSPVTSGNIVLFADLLQKAIDNAEKEVRLLTSAKADDKFGRLGACEAAIREVNQIKKSYIMEMSLLKIADKQPYRIALEGYDARLNELEKTYKSEKGWAEKSLLTGGKVDKNNPKGQFDPNNARDGLLKETINVQNKIDESLQKSLKSMTETVKIGGEVADALEGQKDQIVRINEGVAEVDDELKIANQKLGQIFRRIATDRFVICFAFVLVGLIVVVIALLSTGIISTSSKTPTTGR